jgi:hypothetical protein
MIRHNIPTACMRMHQLPRHSGRKFGSNAFVKYSSRVNQGLENARSNESTAYKTVKEKAPDDKDTRRSQLIWLVKHSLGKEKAGASMTPHNAPWSDGSEKKEGKIGADGVTVTVWPHLW